MASYIDWHNHTVEVCMSSYFPHDCIAITNLKIDLFPEKLECEK